MKINSYMGETILEKIIEWIEGNTITIQDANNGDIIINSKCVDCIEEENNEIIFILENGKKYNVNINSDLIILED